MYVRKRAMLAEYFLNMAVRSCVTRKNGCQKVLLLKLLVKQLNQNFSRKEKMIRKNKENRKIPFLNTINENCIY